MARAILFGVSQSGRFVRDYLHLGFTQDTAGALCPLQGTMLPFAATEADRRAGGDPRPSVAERYGDEAGYRRAVQAGEALLRSERLLLPQDVPERPGR